MTNANRCHPDFPDDWAPKDEDIAGREGWAMVESRGGLEIQRCDVNDLPYQNAPHFKYDDDAQEHVRQRAMQGSDLHQRALAIHDKYAPTIREAYEDEHWQKAEKERGRSNRR